jgi:hypothetical protein
LTCICGAFEGLVDKGWLSRRKREGPSSDALRCERPGESERRQGRAIRATIFLLLVVPHSCTVLRFTHAQIRATIARFYIMTRTSLSAATKAQRDQSARNSSLQPQLLVYPEARRALIHPRNPFLATSHPPLVTRHSPLTCPEEDHRRRRVTALLIHGSAIKTQRKPFENSNLKISNRW